MAQLNAEFVPRNYYRAFPHGVKRFYRFATVPKDIVLEFAFRGLKYYFEENQLSENKKEIKLTYKFAAEEKGEVEYVIRLLNKKGWTKIKNLYHQGK